MIAKIIYKLKQGLGFSTRESLFKILPKNAVCAELGVFKGDFSRLILKHAKPREAHFVDVWWVLFGEHYPDWGAYTDYGKLKTRAAYEEAESKIKPFPGKHVIHAGSDLDYLQTFSDAYFDWVYIDSSHEYEHTRQELELLKHKLKPGGIICGHDWYDDETHIHYGVKKAVVEFCQAYGWKLIYQDNYLQWAIAKN